MDQSYIPAALQPDLHQVAAIITQRVAERSIVRQITAQHLDRSGDGYLRAVLVLLAAQAGRYQLGRTLHAAAAVELIHAATLVHEGLVSEAERRRGVVPHISGWEGDVGLMVGDYLLALAASEMAQAPDARIIDYFSRAVMTIAEGQLAPVAVLNPTDLAVEQYLFRAGAKTAALFESASQAGGVCGDMSDEQVAALGRFGYQLGLAFQIASDLRDYREPPVSSDHPAVVRLRAGIVGLPLIYAVASSAATALHGLLDQTPSDERARQAVAAIRQSGALERASADLENYVNQAREQLAAIPDSAPRAALASFAQAITTW